MLLLLLNLLVAEPAYSYGEQAPGAEYSYGEQPVDATLSHGVQAGAESYQYGATGRMP